MTEKRIIYPPILTIASELSIRQKSREHEGIFEIVNEDAMAVVFDDVKCFFMRKKKDNRIGVPYKINTDGIISLEFWKYPRTI